MRALLRYGLIAFASVLWCVGLADQLHSATAAATYLALSALMAGIVLL